nr:alpha/beta hydrolase [Paracoccus binzhouensis]
MDAVAAAIREPCFVLLGLSQGGALAIACALRHPERVSHLVLLNAYAQGKRVRARTEAERLEAAEMLVNFVRIGWGCDNPAFCKFFTNLFIPDGLSEQHFWWGDLEWVTASAEVAAELLSQMQGIDVSDLAPQLHVPTLVAHCRSDMRLPFDEGCRLAAAIPGRIRRPSWPKPVRAVARDPRRRTDARRSCPAEPRCRGARQSGDR